MKKRALMTGLAGILLISLALSGCSSTDPSASGSLSSPALSAQAEKAPAEKEATLVFYKASEDGLKIIPVQMKVKAADRTAKNSIEEMIRADRHAKYPILPADLTLKSISIKDGVAYVNFNKSLNTLNSETAQTLFTAMTVDTLTEFPNIREVEITAEGQVPRFQLDMTKHFKRDESYIRIEKE